MDAEQAGSDDDVESNEEQEKNHRIKRIYQDGSVFVVL